MNKRGKSHTRTFIALGSSVNYYPLFQWNNFTANIVNQTQTQHTHTKVTIQGKPTEINLISRYQELFIIKLKTSYRRQNMKI